MFRLRYRIFEQKSDRQYIDLNISEEEASIYGFISLKFNQREIGYIIDEEEAPSPEDIKCEIYLYHDNLTWWFETLLEVSKLLNKQQYVRFKVLESVDSWISLEKDNSNIIVTSFKCFDSGGEIVSSDRVIPETVYFTEIIGLNEFQKEVNKNIKEFIKEVGGIYQILFNTNRLHSLCQESVRFE